VLECDWKILSRRVQINLRLNLAEHFLGTGIHTYPIQPNQ